MTDEQVRRQLSAILSDLDVSFSMKRNAQGNSQWTIEFTSDDKRIQIVILASANWILTAYVPESLRQELNVDQLRQLLRLNLAIGVNTKIGISDVGFPIAWSEVNYSVPISKETVQHSLKDTLDAARHIIEIVPSLI